MNVLPCPFCGVMPEIKKHWFIGTYEARCPNCEAWPTKYVDCNTTDEAVKCWNARKLVAAPPASAGRG